MKPYAKQAVEFVKKNPGKIAIGAAGVGLAADDIQQRGKVKEAEKRTVEIKEALRKNEAKYQSAKEKAEKADELIIINEQLCDALKSVSNGESEDEAQGDRTTD